MRSTSIEIFSARALTTIGLCCVAGCVTGGNYEACYSDLREAKQKLRAELADRDARISGLETQLADAENNEAALSESEAKLQAALASTSANLDQLKESESANSQAITSLSDERARLKKELEKLEKDRTALQDQSSKMRTQLKDLSAREAEVKKEVAQYRELLQRFGKMVDSGKLKVEVKNGRMVLALASDVLFPSASAELSEAGKAAIAEIAGVLKGVKDKTFQIEGHTDNVPIKTEQFASNWYLAMARAMVVLEAMLSGGVSPKVLSAASYAEYRPVGSNKTVPGRAANRRIEIVFVPYIAGLPDQSDLAKAAAEK